MADIFLSVIAVSPQRDNESSLAFRNILFFCCSKGSKTFAVFALQGDAFLVLRWVAAPKAFWPKLTVFHLASPDELFSAGQISVLSVDVLDDCLFSARILSSSSLTT